MALYYFEVREGLSITEDQDGLEFASSAMAEAEAVRAAVSIAGDCLPQGAVRDVAVEVLDEHREPLLTATVGLLVERLQPST
ncbi:DUF6894 family protein [Streptomyces sp. NPDC017988]